MAPNRSGSPLHLRVFLASPSDVEKERRIARDLLLRLPRQPLLAGRVTLEVVSSDDPEAPVPYTSARTPQSDVVRAKPAPALCDLTIVILWSRFGTRLPPEVLKPDGSAYGSGTEWEYEDARSAGRDVLIYHRTEEPKIRARGPRGKEQSDQYRAVRDFLSKLRNSDGSMRGGYNKYRTPADFRSLFARHIEALIRLKLDSGQGGRDPEPRSDIVAHYLRSAVSHYAERSASDPTDLQQNLFALYVEPAGAQEPSRSATDHIADGPIWVSLETELRKGQPCMVLGDFGMGKSWLLQMTHYRLCERAIASDSGRAGWIPFLINLRNYRRPASPDGNSFLRRLLRSESSTVLSTMREAAWTSAFGESHVAETRAGLLEEFEAGSHLFLLDGVDEMNRSDADALLAELGELARATFRSPFLLTSRRSYFRDAADEKRISDLGFKVFYIYPWSRQQLIEYLDRAHRIGALPVPASEVIDRLDRRPDLLDVGSRALLASMFVDQWSELQSDGTLDMPTLYERHIEKAVLLWQGARARRLSVDQIKEWMEEVAYLMFRLDRRTVTTAELDQYFSKKFKEHGIDRFDPVAQEIAIDTKTNGFLIRHGNSFAFCHASFGDFLLARKLLRALRRGDQEPFRLIDRSREYAGIAKNFLIPMLQRESDSALVARFFTQ